MIQTLQSATVVKVTIKNRVEVRKALKLFKDDLVRCLEPTFLKSAIVSIKKKAEHRALYTLLRNLEDAKIEMLARKHSAGTDQALENHEGYLGRIIGRLKDKNLKLLEEQASDNKLTKIGDMLKNLDHADTLPKILEALKYFEKEILVCLQSIDLPTLIKDTSNAKLIPPIVKKTLLSVHHSVPHPLKYRYLMLHVYKEIVKSDRLFDCWLQLLRRIGGVNGASVKLYFEYLKGSGGVSSPSSRIGEEVGNFTSDFCFSKTVGLSAFAYNLQENLMKHGILPSLVSLRILDQSQDTKIQESESEFVLLGVKAIGPSEASFKYQWYKNGEELDDNKQHHKCNGSGECIIRISIDDLTVDGSYICIINDGNGRIESEPILLTIETPLDKYRERLTDIYTAQPEVPEDTWPPVNINAYINLALIKQQGINNAGEYARCTIRGDADDVFKDKESIQYKKAFGNIGSGVRLLIEGRPGSGKTTLVHKVSQDWARSELEFGNIRLLFLVHLRGFHSNPEIKLQGILNCYYDNDTDIVKYAIKHSGLGLCFILDGLDEYLPETNNTYIHKLITKRELPRSMVIVASRPAAVADFRSSATRQIEVLGFLKEQICEYIKEYSFSSECKRSELHKYLDHHPNVHNMCYLPIHTAMVCFLCQVSETLPETETGIYNDFTISFFIRTLRNDKKNIYIKSIESLPPSERESYLKICKLAFEMTVSSKQVMLHDDVDNFFDIHKDKDCLGLITIDRAALRYGMQELYTFLHLTFQEFLAAYHISHLEEEEQTRIIDEYGSAKQMQAVWKFYCGLVRFDKNNKFETLLDRAQYGTLYKVQCSLESQQPCTCNSIVEDGGLSFKDTFLTPSDFNAIAFVVSNATQGTIDTLVFDGCTLVEEGISILVKKAKEKISLLTTLCFHGHNCVTQQLASVNKLMHALPSLEILDITSTQLGRDAVNALTDGLNHSNLKVLKIDASDSNPLYSPGDLPQYLINYFMSHCKNFVNVYFSDNTKKDLSSKLSLPFYFYCISESSDVNMSFCKLQLIEVKVLSNDIRSSSAFSRFSLINCNICDEGAKLLANGIKRCSTIETLELSLNLISDEGAMALSDSIQNCVDLHTLDLSCNHIGDKGALAITNTVRDKKSFKLLLWTNDITEHGADVILQSKHDTIINTLSLKSKGIGSDEAESIGLYLLTQRCHRVLHTLDIGSNHFGDDGAKSLADALKNSTNLYALYIDSNDIGENGAKYLVDGIKYLAFSIKHGSMLHTLDIHSNCIGADGAKYLADGIKHCSMLHTLDISSNHIGDNGIKDLADIFKDCSKLHTLDTSFNDIGAEGAKYLADGIKHCSNLHRLDIHSNHIGADGAKYLADGIKHCSMLHTLDIGSNNIGNNGIKDLANVFKDCCKLHTLDIHFNHIGADGAKYLADGIKHCSMLHTLDISCNSIGDNGIEDLANVFKDCSDLHKLDIHSNHIGTDGAKYLADGIKHCSMLHTLDISCNSIGDNGIEDLANVFKDCSDLHKLDIHSNHIGTDGAKYLADGIKHCSMLHTLDIHSNNICADGAKYLADGIKHCSMLHTLDISCNSIGDNGIEDLANVFKDCSDLHKLDIHSNHIRANGAKYLADGIKHCSNLHRLDIHSNHIGADGAKYLADGIKHCSMLHTLDIGSNNIGNNGIKDLANVFKDCCKLHTLDIHFNDIGADGAKYLADGIKHCSMLHTLDISCNSIGDNGIEDLANVFKDCSDLHKLDIHSNHIGTDGAKYLADGIKHCSMLHTLDISCNSIGDNGIEDLANVFKDCSDLHKLDIHSNHIGTDGAKYLADGIKHCSMLHTLDIHSNNICADGAKYLADGIKHCSMLHTLDISCNSIGDNGIEDLANVFKDCSDLHKLDIHSNHIRANGAKYLADGIKHCSMLHTLDIHSNNICADGAKYLADGIKHCSMLHTLDISCNSIGDNGIEDLANVFKDCSDLHKLDIHSNHIRANGAKYLADGIKHCSMLHTLDIHSNNICADGAKYLADGIKHCSMLHMLDIHYNYIHMDGAEYLADGIKHCSMLHTLNIHSNLICADGAKYLADGIKHCSMLHTLNIQSNLIGADGAKYLADGIKHCSMLHTFDIRYNSIGDNGIKHLVNVFKDCSKLHILDQQ